MLPSKMPGPMRRGLEKELPSEAEWEFAARGGLEAAEFTWGSEFTPDGEFMANTWQGEFPLENALEDGFEWTAPVGSFPPNDYGLYDMAGNVWEWTTDWYLSTASSRTLVVDRSIRAVDHSIKVTIPASRTYRSVEK